MSLPFICREVTAALLFIIITECAPLSLEAVDSTGTSDVVILSALLPHTWHPDCLKHSR